jgi:hypothetical protein
MSPRWWAAAKREAVAHLRAELGLSERRACSIVSADRKMIRYRSYRPPDTELRVQLRELANARRRLTIPALNPSIRAASVKSTTKSRREPQSRFSVSTGVWVPSSSRV